MSQFEFFAAEVPLEMLQRHSKGRKPRNQANCRRSAPGDAPAALKRQKAQKSSKLPLKCPWRCSSATQKAESPEIKQIAGEVPLEDAPRALKRQKALKSSKLPLKCRWRNSRGTQKAESPEIKQIAGEVPLEPLQGHSKGRKQ